MGFFVGVVFMRLELLIYNLNPKSFTSNNNEIIFDYLYFNECGKQSYKLLL